MHIVILAPLNKCVKDGLKKVYTLHNVYKTYWMTSQDALVKGPLWQNDATLEIVSIY